MLFPATVITRDEGDRVMVFIYSLPFSSESKVDYKYYKDFSIGSLQKILDDQ